MAVDPSRYFGGSSPPSTAPIRAIIRKYLKAYQGLMILLHGVEKYVK